MKHSYSDSITELPVKLHQSNKYKPCNAMKLNHMDIDDRDPPDTEGVPGQIQESQTMFIFMWC